MGSAVVYQIFLGINRFLSVLEVLLIIYALMTWFVRPDSPVYQFLYRFLNPVIAPFRRISRKLIERGLMIDISVILAVLAIRVVQSLLWRLYALIF
ncbi:MAG: YggT family protein [Clostridia bacterium]|nr:YggT family protein [Clostridia bacterium]